MSVSNIPYRSFCWVIGTTSFRAAKLNLKIEEQLFLLADFQKYYLARYGQWIWDSRSQKEYYNFMKEKGFLTGDAVRKDKDAREKTSGLVDIGLLTPDRKITEAGWELLTIVKDTGFTEKDPKFNIPPDSYVYFRQLLKTAIKVNDLYVRPYLVLARALAELGSVSYEEFTYLLPLAVTKQATRNIIEKIKQLRLGKVHIDDIIIDDLMGMPNYRLAWQTFLEQEVSEKTICLIGMNRKSRSYDKVYHHLYKALKSVYLDGQDDCSILYQAAQAIMQKPGVMWRQLLFAGANRRKVIKKGLKALNSQSPFLTCTSEEQFKGIFFKYLHVFKAKATLSDYFDLNRRYFNLTDTLIFEDQGVRFDLIPKHFFNLCIERVFDEAFSQNAQLWHAVPLGEIAQGLVFNEKNVYANLSEELGVTVSTPQQLDYYIKHDRYRRFNRLIEKRFPRETLIELLVCFKDRNDRRIEELVTDDASIPTIFEYILAIIWYEVSEKQGNILDYMKLSLDASLLPKSHATGGTADIIYEYEQCQNYPRHSLLIEATLADGVNQRRQEMEPVSRHLGDHILKTGNQFDYALFVCTFLHPNVVSDFRMRKTAKYFSSDGQQSIEGMKIISVDTDDLSSILENRLTYKYLYALFERYYQSSTGLPDWRNDLIKEIRGDYHVGGQA